MPNRLVLAAFVVLVACKKPDDAYKQDIQTICDGPASTEKQSPGVMAKMDPSQQGRVIAETIVPQIKTAEGKAFFHSLASELLGPKDKAKKLSAEATKVGIAKCGMSDFWNK